MKHIARSAIVERSAQEMYALVEDIEAYPSFLPWCLAAEFHERRGAHSLATLTLGANGLRYSLTTRNRHSPGRSIEMHLVEGPFKHFSAAWHFTPLEAGAAKIEFRMDYEFASRALAAVLEPLFKGIANDMVEAFARRVR